MKQAVKTLEGKDAGEITLDKAIFGVDVEKGKQAVQDTVKYQRNKARSGTRKTQTRNEVTGTGKKPWAQKGTGRARAGDLKRNLDRGGQVAHGPVVRDHSTNLPKKVRQLAMKTILSAKAKDGKLIIIDDAKAKDHKTKPMADSIAKLGVTSAIIVGGQEVDVNFARATANLPCIDVIPSQGANVYDIMRRDTLVLTKDAVENITAKLKG